MKRFLKCKELCPSQLNFEIYSKYEAYVQFENFNIGVYLPHDAPTTAYGETQSHDLVERVHV